MVQCHLRADGLVLASWLVGFPDCNDNLNDDNFSSSDWSSLPTALFPSYYGYSGISKEPVTCSSYDHAHRLLKRAVTAYVAALAPSQPLVIPSFFM